MRFLFLSFLLMNLVNLFAQSEKPVIFVHEFKAQCGLAANEIRVLSDHYNDCLINSNQFTVITKNLRSQLIEQANSDLVSEIEVKVTVFPIAQVLVLPSIGKIGNKWALNLKVVDVNSSRIVLCGQKDHVGEVESLLKVNGDFANSLKSSTLQDALKNPKQDISVIVNKFTSRAGMDSDIMSILENRFIAYLTANHSINVIERADMQLVLDEQEFGMEHGSDKISIGRHLQANRLISTTIDKLGSEWIISAKCIDLNAVDVLFSIRESHSGEPEELLVAIKSLADSVNEQIR